MQPWRFMPQATFLLLASLSGCKADLSTTTSLVNQSSQPQAALKTVTNTTGAAPSAVKNGGKATLATAPTNVAQLAERPLPPSFSLTGGSSLFGLTDSFTISGHVDAKTTVSFYATTDCTGTPLLSADSDEFAAGVTLPVPAYGRLALFAEARSEAGLSSECTTLPATYTRIAWTWENGQSQPPYSATFGTLGVEAAGNLPPPRGANSLWHTNDDKLWVFGGNSATGYGDLSDLWTFNETTQQWTWVKGPNNTAVNSGNYGSLGVEASTNAPPNRAAQPTWTGKDGNLYLYSGFRFQGTLTDLWRFSPATGNWTWIQGSSVANTPEAYGTLGVASPSNVSPPRFVSTTWVDPAGALWVFGGINARDSSIRSDLWKFDLTTLLWTWMGGPNVSNQSGTYGQQGVEATSNWPGARQGTCFATDQSGVTWVFGGTGLGNSSAPSGYLNDLWQWSSTTSAWTWISGDQTVNSLGVYGTQNVASPSSVPGGRRQAACWLDSNGRFWLFGGEGADATVSSQGNLSDLWVYDPAISQWTWVNGPSSQNVFGTYGQLGIASAADNPGARGDLRYVYVPDQHKVVLFGGNGVTSTGSSVGALNDMWTLAVP